MTNQSGGNLLRVYAAARSAFEPTRLCSGAGYPKAQLGPNPMAFLEIF